MRPQVGQVINNKYRLVRLIGDGGMGSVYEAKHEVLGMSVALKFLHPELSRRSGLVQRFLQEARVSAQIQSPHVVRVTDVEQAASGLAFIVLEYLEGKTLQTLYEDLYTAGQRLGYADALDYAVQMIEGVEAAHTAGIVHRDLKPDNLMIVKGKKGDSIVKILDFGIAKLKVTGELDRGLTRPGVVMGTPEYMAPEQAFSADAVDARADIFSLGVIIFEMLAGRRPVGGDEPQQIAASYLSGQVARLGDLAPHVAPELAAAIHRAMAPLPKDRFASVGEMRDVIEPFALAVRPQLASLLGGTPSVPGVRSSNDFYASTPSPGLAVAAASALPSGMSRVPKTLPPEDEPEVRGDATRPVAPLDVAHSQVPSRDPTPLGGFGYPAQAPSGRGSIPMGGGTVEAAPYRPSAPVLGNGTAYGVPIESARMSSGGTASGAVVFQNGSGMTALGAPGQYGGGVPSMGGVGAYASGSMPMAPPAKKQRGGAAMLALILLLAAAVTGSVVGGLMYLQNHAKTEDHDDTPIPVTPPSTTVKGDPPPIDPTAPPPPTGPQTKPPPNILQTRPTHPPSPNGPRPPPSTAPSNGPPVIPSILPPLPFPPGFPPIFGPNQQPSPTPSVPPSNPQPADPPASSGRPPIIIRVPHGT